MGMLAKKPPKIDLRGKGVAALHERLLDLIRAGQWPLLEPLPVTRFLGKSFGVSNVSAFRVLNELSHSGRLWRAANGRYFLPEARRLLERPAPIGCLIRRLERWTQVGREIMLGVDEACGEMERAILLVHDRVLFRQADPTARASAGSDREIRQSMEDFLTLHSERIGGIVLDELWPDKILAKFESRIRGGVILYRNTKLPFLGCVSADVASAAKIVVDHAVQEGFKLVTVLVPYPGYRPSEEMVEGLQIAAKGQFGALPVVTFDSVGAVPRGWLAKLRRQRSKMLLVATEDNSAVSLFDSLVGAGIDVPNEVGLVTTMGSQIARDRSITAAGFDFRRMGYEAARMAASGRLNQIRLPAILQRGTTA